MNVIVFIYFILVTLSPFKIKGFLSVNRETGDIFCYLKLEVSDCKLWNNRLCKYKAKEDCYSKKHNRDFCLNSLECLSGN